MDIEIVRIIFELDATYHQTMTGATIITFPVIPTFTY